MSYSTMMTLFMRNKHTNNFKAVNGWQLRQNSSRDIYMNMSIF